VKYQFLKKEPYYYIILIMLLLVLALTYVVSRRKMGYYLAAGGRSPRRRNPWGERGQVQAHGDGHELFSHGLGGTFYAQLMLYFYPKGILGLDLSFELAFIALIGGRGTIAGPILGAFLLRPLNEFTRIYLSGYLPGLHLVIFGLILILVMIYQPRGLQEPLSRLYARLVHKMTTRPHPMDLEKA